MERVADYIIRRLTQEGISRIFMITGRGVLYLTDAVAKNPEIEGISLYHEQGASYAAMAYASARDGMGACLVSTGCAATNAVTAALCAWQDNIPCVFLSGQHMLHETTRYTGLPIRTYGSQEADIVSIVKPVTKYAVMLTEAADTAYEMDKAICLADSGRKGPVWIDVPLDVQNMRIEPERLRRYEPGKTDRTGQLLRESARQVAEELQQAARPLLFIGGGVRSSRAQGKVREFLESCPLPVVFSTSAADTYGSGNRLSIGAVGSLGGSRAGNFAVQNADYLLVLGSKLCSQTVGAEPEKFARGARITVVDIDRNEHSKKGVSIDRLIEGDVGQFLKCLIEYRPAVSCREWTERCLHWKEVFDVSKEGFLKGRDEWIFGLDLYHFADVLSGLLPEDAAVVTDAGFEELIIPSTVKYRDGQRCLFPAAQGAMGYAIPAVVGVYFAGKRNVVAVVGDGSFMMNMQELQAVSWHKIPAKIFVVNNNMYAVIRRRQKDLFRQRTIGNDPSDGLGAPDFRRIADSFGIPYVQIRGESELSLGIQRVLAMDSPCICEVMCREDQPYLHSSFAINSKRRLVRRPLEDLSPFLDRNVFISEMVIEPIEQ